MARERKPGERERREKDFTLEAVREEKRRRYYMIKVGMKWS